MFIVHRLEEYSPKFAEKITFPLSVSDEHIDGKFDEKTKKQMDGGQMGRRTIDIT